MRGSAEAGSRGDTWGGWVKRGVWGVRVRGYSILAYLGRLTVDHGLPASRRREHRSSTSCHSVTITMWTLLTRLPYHVLHNLA